MGTLLDEVLEGRSFWRETKHWQDLGENRASISYDDERTYRPSVHSSPRSAEERNEAVQAVAGNINVDETIREMELSKV